MKVIRAKVLGFCMGVRRAVEIALSESDSSAETGRQVYTLGPLIHNPRVLEDLEKRGVRILKEGEAVPDPENATVIIRSHGVAPDVENDLAAQGLRVLHATCAHVLVSQEKARSFAEKGYMVFLAGEENHGEIAGIRGCAEAACTASCYVVGSAGEAERAGEGLYRKEPAAATVLIGQTTISPGEYRAIGEALKRFFPDIEILNTICGATADRRKALEELCAVVDAVVIAGGQESANTRRLFSLARDLGKPAWLVEKPEDILEFPEISAYETVGLSAGASTPDSLIDDIEKALKAL